MFRVGLLSSNFLCNFLATICVFTLACLSVMKLIFIFIYMIINFAMIYIVTPGFALANQRVMEDIKFDLAV